MATSGSVWWSRQRYSVAIWDFLFQGLDGRAFSKSSAQRYPYPTPPNPCNAIRLCCMNPWVRAVMSSSLPTKLLASKGKGTIGLNWWYAWATGRLAIKSSLVWKSTSICLNFISHHERMPIWKTSSHVWSKFRETKNVLLQRSNIDKASWISLYGGPMWTMWVRQMIMGVVPLSSPLFGMKSIGIRWLFESDFEAFLSYINWIMIAFMLFFLCYLNTIIIIIIIIIYYY